MKSARAVSVEWRRLKRSLSRRWREFRLPHGYLRLGTKYGGWWIDRNVVTADPFVIDCGLGRDISFDVEFLAQFGGTVVGVDPNPESLAWCSERCPPGMQLRDRAFWTTGGASLTFHLPRAIEHLPPGADGISGSLHESHEYVRNGGTRTVQTTDLAEIMTAGARHECDVLKLDIEGAEYEVLADLVGKRTLSCCRQVLVEFHHHATHHTIEDTERAIAGVRSAGFDLMHVEGRNHTFRRSGLA